MVNRFEAENDRRFVEQHPLHVSHWSVQAPEWMQGRFPAHMPIFLFRARHRFDSLQAVRARPHLIGCCTATDNTLTMTGTATQCWRHMSACDRRSPSKVSKSSRTPSPHSLFLQHHEDDHTLRKSEKCKAAAAAIGLTVPSKRSPSSGQSGQSANKPAVHGPASVVASTPKGGSESNTPSTNE